MNERPYEKGIKTKLFSRFVEDFRMNERPYEKGIKTVIAQPMLRDTPNERTTL